jgi:hypothetical protein
VPIFQAFWNERILTLTDLTGTWESEVIDPASPQKHVGKLKITHTGILVSSNSAPGWDMWHGYVEVLNGAEVLTAFCLHEGVQCTIKAKVASNGALLLGSWQSNEPLELARSGVYLARRKIPTE